MFNVINESRESPTITSAHTLVPDTGALMARIQAQGAAVRYTVDGSTPSGSVGYIIADGEYIDLPTSRPIKLFSASGAAEVTYWT